MIVRKPLVVIALSLSLAGLTACGGAVEQEPRPACPVGYALDGTGEDADECEVDENQDGIGDDDQGISGEEAGAGAAVGGAAKKLLKKKRAKKKSGVTAPSRPRTVRKSK